jgi:hypothetical protein
VIVKMNNPGRFIFHDHIDRHVTNDGKYPGGAITIIEYDGISKEPWYVWKDKDATYDPNFFYSESMKQGYGIFNSPGFAGQPIEQTRRHQR